LRLLAWILILNTPYTDTHVYGAKRSGMSMVMRDRETCSARSGSAVANRNVEVLAVV